MKGFFTFLWASLLWIGGIFAQPAQFTFTPTNSSGTMLGQAQLSGTPADGADWIAAFDATGNCAGAAQMTLFGGDAYINLPIYGDDATTPAVDEGMDGGEDFFLFIWDASANAIYPYPSPCSPTAFSGWSNSNGAPMPGYNDPNVIYDFTPAAPPTATLGTFAAVCENDPAFPLSGGSPTGGVYSGTGVSGGQFDPAVAGAGTFTITYIYTDATVCLSDTATSTITVNVTPTVTQTPFTDLCEGAATVTLSGGSPAGGTYSGTGVSGGQFDPAVAGVGTFPIVYTFSDGNGCSGTVTESITVHPAPSVALIGLADACEDVASIPLSGGSPAGGTYSGMGVSGGQFMPASVGPGTYTITYDFSDGNGCSNSATSTITVNALPTVTHSALSDVCENAGLVSLSGGSPAGGTYSGPGISGGDFDPAVVGPGTYQIDYTFTDGNSCSDFETVAITVLAAPNATLTAAADTVCLDASMITLTGMPMGGTFSGPGVTGNMFDPDAAGAGTAPISYVFTDGSGCSDTAETIVVVSGLPTVSLSAASNAICENEAPITLTASPAGGTLSGPGVNGGSFDPALAGVGVFELVYEYTDNTSCSNSDTFSIEVFAAPTASFAPDADSVCINDAPISLNGAPTEGIFSGGGVSGDQFDPMMAGIGTQSITYLFTDANGCSDSSSLNVEVLPQAETPVISNDGQIMSVSSAADSFQWFLNGVAIPGETGSTYLPGDTGSTATVVAYLNGCASDTSGGKLTARDLLFGQAELVLFPNPSTAQVELHLHQLPVRGELHLDLLDIQGRLVFQRLDQVNGDDFQTTFDFSSLARGLYLLRISQEGQLIGSQKLRLE